MTLPFSFRRWFAVLASVVLAAGLQAAVVNATYSAATDVPLTATSIAAGDTVTFALNFAPPVGTELMVVKNPGLPFLAGTFANLAQGQTVALNFGTTTYQFVAHYHGGTGNDLVLVWANTARPFSWGGNNYGELGNNTTVKSVVPSGVIKTGVLAPKTVVALSAGWGHSLALNADGTLAAWGWDQYSQLGGGLTVNSKVPALANTSAVPAPGRLVAIASGDKFNLALSSDGKVLAWGNNDFGQLGNNTFNGWATPQFVTATGALAGRTFVAVAAGFNHSLALSSDGQVFAWGMNGAGQVGVNTSASSYPLPVAVLSTGALAGKTVVAIAAGHYHNLVLCSDGTLVAWGWNNSGQLGNGSFTQSLAPTAVPLTGALAGKTVVAITVGAYYSAALCADGTVATWGANSSGQLGNGSTATSNVPVAVTATGVLAGKTVVRLAAGATHLLALCADGTVATWGNNFSGQLGDGSTTSSLVPVAVSTASLGTGARVTGIFTGSESHHSLALVAAPPVPVPEIDVLGNAQSIPNGATTPLLADHTDFGSVPAAGNATQTRTFTVKNTGSADLALTGTPDKVVVTGGNAPGDFTVSVPPAALVSALNGTTTFQVTFNPSAIGLRTATLSLANSDSDENPYVFAIQGNGGAPEIDVLGNGVSIANGFSVPVLGNHTDFGGVLVAGNATQTRTFTIKNTTGTADLNLIGTPDRVLVSGGNAAGDFTVTLQPAALVPAITGTTTFQVTFNPTAPGVRTAQLSIPNDDADENPYVFTIQGHGTDPAMLVRGNSVTILDGSTTTTYSDDTFFGPVGLCGGTPNTNVFTIHNFGTTPLTLTGSPLVVLGGANASDFTFTQPALTTIPANGQTTFSVTFSPTALGPRTATLSIASDDSAVNPYNFTIEGTGVAPEIDVAGGGGSVSIADGSTTPLTTNGTDFGAVALGGGTPGVQTFIITNSVSATAPLLLTGSPLISVSGAHAGDFTVTPPTVSSLAPGASTTFTVVFSPLGAGVRTAALSIANNDCDEGPYNFALKGDSLGDPEIVVSGLGQNIVSGAVTASSVNDTQFIPVTAPGGTAGTHTFTITNSGTTALTVNSITVTPGAFSTPPLTTPVVIPPASGGNNTMTFDVTFLPGSVALHTATVSLGSDDSDENPFTFVVAGRGREPSLPKANIEVSGNATMIGLGDLTPTTGDHTRFPDTGWLGNATSTRTFTITNTGGAPLILTGLNSVNSAEFAISAFPSTPIGAGNASSFSVTFNPAGPGIRSSLIQVFNSVTSSSYDFLVEGKGATLIMVGREIDVTGNNVSIADGDGYPSTLDYTHFGNVSIFLQSRTRTFTIRNTGTTSLTLGTVTATGGNSLAGEFTVTQQPAGSLAANATTTFKVKFDPAALGSRFSNITIPNNDANESPYNFTIRGLGKPGPGSGSGWTWAAGPTGTLWQLNVDALSDTSVLGDTAGTFGGPIGVAWGSNPFGQLGNASALAARLPVAVSTTGLLAGRSILELAVGQNHTVALCSDGSLLAWGQGSSGQLGNGALADSLAPVAVTMTGALAGKTVMALAAGQAHTLALCTDGTVVAWGAGSSGQLGNNTIVASSVPVAVTATGALAGKSITALAAGDLHSIALCSDGTVVAWGGNTHGQLGNGTTTASAVPVVSTTTGATSPLAGRTLVALAAGGSHTLVACADGTVAGWGRNHAGQLGDNSIVDRLSPVLVSTTGALTGKTVVALAAGSAHSLALCSDDTLVAWGQNSSGQLGDGTRVNRLLPTLVTRPDPFGAIPVIALAAGANHSVALTADGQLAAWGANASGQLGTNDTASRVTPTFVQPGVLAAGSLFTRVVSGASSASTLALATAPAPAIALAGSTYAVPNATGLSAPGDDTDFGHVEINGGTAGRTFTLTNTGGAPLVLTGTPKVAVGGTHAAEFIVNLQPVSPVAPHGGTTTFEVIFAPAAVGPRLATLTLASDDPAQGTYTFDLTGTGTAPGALDGLGNLNANNIVFTTAVQPDGKNVLGGHFTNFGGLALNRAARLEVDGSPDLVFAPDANGLVATTLVQADGAIVLGGSFTTVGGVARNRLARVTADGTLDLSFNPDADSSVSALALQPDGKLIVTGNFTTLGGVARGKIARLHADGTLDLAFNPNANRAVYTAAMQPDGKIILAGNFDTVGGVTRQRIARVHADGTLDTAFDPNPTSDVTSIVVQPDGKIVIGGQFGAIGGVTRSCLARLQADGSLDTGFNPNVDTAVYTLAAQADGKILLGGSFHFVGGVERTRLARLHPDGTLDLTFVASADDDVVFSTALQADGKVVLAGYFASVNGTGRNFFARLDNDPAPQSLTVTAANRVRWLRGGASPETLHVTFEHSADGGATWNLLGAGTRLATGGGWELTGLNLAGTGQIRARARTTGGAYTGSSGLVETITAFSVSALPVITTQPISQTALAGTDVTFTVVASGTPAPTYQWMRGNAAGNVALSGATNATLILPGVQAANVASYSVVVTNASGSVTSSFANLTVTAVPLAPAIVTPPVAQTVTAGNNVTFTVVASGAPTLTYQWRKGTVAISGATNASLALSAVAVLDAGSFDVVVSNAVASVTSAAVVLTVNVPPTIATQPASLGAGLGTGVVFSVTASGTLPLTYQWSKDGTAIPGATLATLSLTNVSAASAGVYRVAVSNTAGTLVSDPATLAVFDAFAHHAVAGPGYMAGGTVTIVNTLNYSDATSGLGWSLLLPPGWSYSSGSGNEGNVKPSPGATNLLEWAWTTIPTAPLAFTYTLNVPAGTTGDKLLTALAIVRQAGVVGQILAKPDPLVVSQVTTHSADTTRDHSIGLVELTRVIELYNVRIGTTRTGGYSVLDGSEDGFAPDFTRLSSAAVTLTRYHHGDSNHDGRFSLLELTRVIELFNTRSGTTRTGQYHVAAGTEDGFAPGP